MWRNNNLKHYSYNVSPIQCRFTDIISSQITVLLRGGNWGIFLETFNLHRKNCLNQCILNGNDRDYHLKLILKYFLTKLYFFSSGVLRRIGLWSLDNQHNLFVGFILSFSISETFCHINSAEKQQPAFKTEVSYFVYNVICLVLCSAEQYRQE